MQTHFSLFSGIGGIDLAAEWAGFETVGQCEYADYPTMILEKHWPDVPRWRDIRDVTAESVRAKGIENITIISGGFPCQPFSVAGQRRGKEDDRYLWPEMCRVISELRPTWVLGENVPGIVNMALDQVLADLEDQDYETITFNIPACAVDAPHRRARIFILAHSRHNRRGAEQWGKYKRTKEPVRCSAKRLEARDAVDWNPTPRASEGGPDDWWATEPDVGRVAHGIPSRVDRLRCLGNAVVPQQIYPILKAIYEIELSRNH